MPIAYMDTHVNLSQPDYTTVRIIRGEGENTAPSPAAKESLSLSRAG